MRKRAALRVCALGVAAVGLVAQSAMAQSTIMNVPSTDTVAAGKVYGEFDLLYQLPGPDDFASTLVLNPRVVVGFAHDVEVGVNVPIYHNGDADPSNFYYVQPNVKWKFFKNDAMGLAASAGVVVNTPLNEREGQGTWSYVYGNVSKKIMGAKGPRITGGGFGVVANDKGKSSFGKDRAGILVAYEQPVTARVSIVADWFSGKNGIGYLTPAISVSLPNGGLFNAGYSIGNAGEDDGLPNNKFLFVYYGMTF